MPNLSLTQRSMLVVDTDPDFPAQLEALLPEHRIAVARTAFEAISRANASTFHAYVLAYWLPDWSGPALCRELRKSDPHAPVVFCTDSVREQDRARALRAGAVAYLSKPLEPTVLRAKLGAVLTMSELRSLRAKVEEERAVQDELERRLEYAIAQGERAKEMTAASIERTARNKAYRAFIAAHGTRAHFESWWPHVFQSVRANTRVE